MPTAAKATSHRGVTYRMVIPAWRIFSARDDKDQNEDAVSREEIEGIFKDVLRHGRDADGLSPEELREKIRTERLRAALKR